MANRFGVGNQMTTQHFQGFTPPALHTLRDPGDGGAVSIRADPTLFR